MRILFVICLSLIIMGKIGFSQTKGAITPEILKGIKATYKKDGYSKAVTNAVTGNSIAKLAKNRENEGSIDHEFKYKVAVKGITDQKSSGRCWMFTGLNVLRPKVIEKSGTASFEFSPNYLFFWDQFEKANLFLEAIITTGNKPIEDRTVEWLFKNSIGDGGVWNLFSDLVTKYGLIPKEAMPETFSSENTSMMSRIIQTKLRENGLELRKLSTNKTEYKKLEEVKFRMLGDIYRILAINLGEPPEQFIWRYKNKDGVLTDEKTYTPKSFYDEFINLNLDSYVLLMDDPSRPYYNLYEIEYDRDMHEGKNWRFINLPSTEIKVFAKKSIIDNEAMYFSCDVGKQLDKEAGTLDIHNYDYESLFGVKFTMDKKERIQTFESGSSHGMALVGVDVDANDKITKWLLENSWGASTGHNGYLTMTDEWFDQYMFRVVVQKQFVDEKTLKILEQKPTMLPPWDPMFMMDE